jgi:hypothetical protein
MEIEVFRAGNPAADAAGITPADLADIAAFDCSANPIPYVRGHPANDKPADGPIRSFRAEGPVLFADLDESAKGFPAIVAGIKGGSILNRSMAFFGKFHPSNPTPGKLAPKHLGFLGSAAPGIPGMPALSKSLAFADGDTFEATGEPAAAIVIQPAPTAVVQQFDAAPAASKGSTMTDEEIKAAADKLTADQAAHDAKVAAFAASQKTARETANAATVDALVADTKVLPADRDDLVNAFNAVDGGDVIAFSADANKKASPISIIAGIMAKGGKVAPVDGKPISPTEDAPAFSAEGALGEVRAAKHAKYNK